MNESATEHDSTFQMMNARIIALESKLDQATQENINLKAKVGEMETKIQSYEIKMKSLPKTVEDIVSSGTLSFIPPSFDMTDQEVETCETSSHTNISNESTSQISSPTNTSIESPSCEVSPTNASTPRADSVASRKRKRISLKWVWKRDNPQGLAYLESLVQLPNFSRGNDFKKITYEEGIKKNLWKRSTETFLKICSKIDNIHKKN